VIPDRRNRVCDGRQHRGGDRGLVHDLARAIIMAGSGTMGKAIVGVIMGSKSDWDTLRHAATVLEEFGVAHECRVVSAHRTPDWMRSYARNAERRGIEIIIAGAGGAAHLPGMVAAQTLVPVLGVPVQSRSLSGLDSLLSIVQMPAGVPVATFAIGEAGARNAALAAVAILAARNAGLRGRLRRYRARIARQVRGEILT
jgi:5-(carboxyamino)imidazole ribonucleotide mutase